MASTNPEIEAQLTALASLCCKRIADGESVQEDRVKNLCKALLMSGFEQKSGPPLATQLEKRVRSDCKEPAIHRGAEINAVTNEIQRIYDDLVRWQSSQPT
jgi:hypothetical protein